MSAVPHLPGISIVRTALNLSIHVKLGQLRSLQGMARSTIVYTFILPIFRLISHIISYYQENKPFGFIE
ncbi:hypothetical protein J0S82_002270, partial [Galemys pyrenaicus]